MRLDLSLNALALLLNPSLFRSNPCPPSLFLSLSLPFARALSFPLLLAFSFTFPLSSSLVRSHCNLSRSCVLSLISKSLNLPRYLARDTGGAYAFSFCLYYAPRRPPLFFATALSSLSRRFSLLFSCLCRSLSHTHTVSKHAHKSWQQ